MKVLKNLFGSDSKIDQTSIYYKYELNVKKFTGNYWVDGKKIFKKVFPAGSITSTSFILNVNENVSTLIDVTIMTYSSSGAQRPGSFNPYLTELYFNPTNSQLLMSFSSYQPVGGYIIIEFTEN